MHSTAKPQLSYNHFARTEKKTLFPTTPLLLLACSLLRGRVYRAVVSSGFIIPAFRRRVTMRYIHIQVGIVDARWMRHVPPKHRRTPNGLYGVKSQKTMI
jgi:hypothetical protein